MATVKEMMMQDAPASIETSYMMSAGDTFEGTITNTAGDTEDWISIEMEAGTTYTITVTGILAGTDTGAMDTILSLMDSKGGMVDMNDDDSGMGGVSPGSKLVFTPEVSDTYYISVSTYRSNPNLDNSGSYTVSVTGVVVDPTMGMAINGTERVEADTNAVPPVAYVSGNDKLSGTAVNETINGLSGDDTLNGMGGDDVLNGGDHNDLLIGGPGADKLNGGDGQDTIDYSYSPMGVTINLDDGTARGGHADGDTIGDDVEHVRGSMHDDALTGARVGTARHNKLWGLGGDDELDGLRGRDELHGGAGDDSLDGGDDNDILEGGPGADMLTGGDHSLYDGLEGDTASYAGSMMGVTVRLHSGQAMGGDAEGDVFAGSGTPVEYTDSDEEMAEVNVFDIENLTGSANDDILAGDLRNNTIKGDGGDDKIYGGPNPADADKESDAGLTNADMLMGEDGDDMIFGGVGNDTLDGGDGDDTLNGGAGADTFMGGADDDMIYADATDIYDVAADGTRTLKTTNVINGGEDNDTVSFAKLEDGIGATGAAFTLGLQDSELETGTATLVDGVENVIGTQGDDHITGNAGDNVIEGGEGGDVLNGGDPAAGVAGTMGDTLSYAGSDDWVRVTLNAAGSAATTSRGHASGDQATNFENVRGSAYDDDLTGNGDANRLWGGAGDDTIEGGGGNDTLEGGAGADDLDGGFTASTVTGQETWNAEMNTLSYAGSNAGVTINLVTASASGGHASGDTIVTYEELAPIPDDASNEIDVATFSNVTGSMHDDHLTGNHHDNELAGGAGDDTLRGGASNAGARDNALALRGDVLVGGPGADVLDGGEDMNERNDMVPDTSDGAAEGAMLAASVDWAVYKHAMEGIAVDLSTNRGTGGEAMGDTLINIELVWGSEKDDTFVSGLGGNNIEGDGGSDTVSYEASEMGVTVDLSSATQHRSVAVTGTGTDADPFVFPVDADPGAVARPTEGVPRLNAAGTVLTGADGANPENEDTNPNVNGAAGDRLGSIENVTGSAMKDSLTGDTNPNVLKGMGGNDTLTGGDETNGGDTLDGGDGDDILNGEGGADKLMGGAGDDTLNGGDGEDTLTGGSGNDDLNGNGGNDTFVFSTADAGDSDAILDYTAGDKIDLSAFDLTAEQVIAATTLRGTGDGAYAVINLEAHGGGRITIEDVSSLDQLDSATGASADGSITDQATDGAIQELNTDIFIL